ncbi:MAG: hypothetical protein HQL97_09800 [Magnetococcales bacterium]|nr:hypothetical protein [Magnetococcales bacterium]MBF0262112.1 hypothetical protein [Magnetococcales bacterium]
MIPLMVLWGCSESVNDPILSNLIAKDGVLETLERLMRPNRYWSRKVAELEAEVETLRNQFQSRTESYHAGLLNRRHAVRHAVREAKDRHEETQEARIEAIQKHRNDLAHSRDEAKEAGRTLRVQMALLRKAREQLEQHR